MISLALIESSFVNNSFILSIIASVYPKNDSRWTLMHHFELPGAVNFVALANKNNQVFHLHSIIDSFNNYVRQIANWCSVLSKGDSPVGKLSAHRLKQVRFLFHTSSSIERSNSLSLSSLLFSVSLATPPSLTSSQHCSVSIWGRNRPRRFHVSRCWPPV